MRKKSIAILVGLMLFVALATGFFAGFSGIKHSPNGRQRLVIYTSMQEAMISSVVNGFQKRNPHIYVEYRSEMDGKVMAMLDEERHVGRIKADVVWTGEVADFYDMSARGLLLPYKSHLLPEVINPLAENYDGTFTAVRLGTLGIAYNTDRITTPPKTWEDLLSPEYKDAFAVANPCISEASYIALTALAKEFGWEFLSRLGDNGTSLAKGSERVVVDTAQGELAAALAMDYLVNAKIAKGRPIAIAYPKKLLIVPSPVAIFKDARNIDNAKRFVDYLLSQEGQQLIANAGTIPVRKDVATPPEYGLPTASEALAREIKVSYREILSDKDSNIKELKNRLQCR